MSEHQLVETKEDARRKRMSNTSEMVESVSNSSSGDVSFTGESVVVGDVEVRKDSLALILVSLLFVYEVFY